MMGAPPAIPISALGAPILGVRHFAAPVEAALIEVGLPGDETHRTTLGAGAEQRALRSAQHLDAIQIEDHREPAVHTGIDVVGAADQRRVIEVDAGGRRTGTGLDAADLDIRLRRPIVVLRARRSGPG